MNHQQLYFSKPLTIYLGNTQARELSTQRTNNQLVHYDGTVKATVPLARTTLSDYSFLLPVEAKSDEQ